MGLSPLFIALNAVCPFCSNLITNLNARAQSLKRNATHVTNLSIYGNYFVKLCTNKFQTVVPRKHSLMLINFGTFFTIKLCSILLWRLQFLIISLLLFHWARDIVICC